MVDTQRTKLTGDITSGDVVMRFSLTLDPRDLEIILFVVVL